VQHDVLAFAAVVAGIGDQQVMLALQGEAGEVFPVDVASAAHVVAGKHPAAAVDREQLRGIAAIVDHPQHVLVDMRCGQAADLVQLDPW
jgi:hypothetical protein